MSTRLVEFLPSDNGRSGDVDDDLHADRVVGALVSELEALLALDARAFSTRARVERVALARSLDTFLANRAREPAVALSGKSAGGGAGGAGSAESPLAMLDRLVLVLLVRIAQLTDADVRADGGSPLLPPSSGAQLLDVAALYGLAEPARAGEVITRALQRTPALAAELADALDLVGSLLEHATELATVDATVESGLSDIRDAALTLHALAACAPAALGESFLPADGPPSALATALVRCYDRALADISAARREGARGELVREARAHVLLLFGRLIGGVGEAEGGCSGRGRGGRGGARGARPAAAPPRATAAAAARPNRALAAALSTPGAAGGGSALSADLLHAFPAAAAAAALGSSGTSAGGSSSAPPAATSAPSADAIRQLLEMLPGLGAGFATAVLHHSGNDTQRAMNALFDEAALPAALAALPRDLAAWSPAPPAPPAAAARAAGSAPAAPAASGRWQKSSAAQTRELLDARGRGADGRTLSRSALARLASDGFDMYDDDFDDDADALPSSALAPSAAAATAAAGALAGGGGGAEAAGDGDDGDEDSEGVRRGAARRAPAPGDDLSGGRAAASASGPRTVTEWLGALGLAADRYAPLLARAGCGRMELLPQLTDASLRAAGLTNERDRAKVLAGARRLAERAAAAGGGKAAIVAPATGAAGASAGAGVDDYFKSTRLHYDREQKGFWAEDGTDEGATAAANLELARARARQQADGGGGSGEGDEGDDGPAAGGRGGRGGRGGGGGGRGRGRGSGEASAAGECAGGPRRNSRADHARKSHGQQSRAYTKQGRPQA